MIVKLEKGDGVSFVYDLTGDEEETELETVVVTDDDDHDDE